MPPSLFFSIALSSMIPLTELQAAIPIAIARHPEAPIPFIFASAIIGVMVPPLFLIWFLPRFIAWLDHHSAAPADTRFHRLVRKFHAAVHWINVKTHTKHSPTFERWGSLAIFILVAIPGPGTGVWTTSLLAYLFGVRYWKAIGLIFAGILVLATIVTGISVGIIPNYTI